MNTLFSVKDKVVLVTGGTSGIGAMIAEGFVKAGARVYITSRKGDACSATEAALAAHGYCRSQPADVGSEAGRGTVSEWLAQHETQLDVLVNNAGTTWGATMNDYTEAAWDRVLGLNLKAPFFLIRELLPMLEKAASDASPARIINITSIAGQQSASIMAYAYGPSKAALNQLTRTLANEFVSKRITVNAIAPGFFPSKMTAHLRRSDDMERQLALTVPMQRLGSMEDVAGLAIYLSSRAGAYMTGNVIPLDGGMLLRH
jgi:NAD(P)-dependent dehydrogenase (short-subunit alcohol dehydrogenase family)